MHRAYITAGHPDKARFIDFGFKRPNGVPHPATSRTTFDFLGFNQVWARSGQGKDVVRQLTAKSRFACALASVSDWCRHNRHRPISEQHIYQGRMVRGRFAYYGTPGNDHRLRWYDHQIQRIWQRLLSRRGQPGAFLWARLHEQRKRHPLPSPKIVRRYFALAPA
jgi:hypothetical protein